MQQECSVHMQPAKLADDLQTCRHLADSSRGLQTAMDMVLSYEQRSHTALAHLLGRSWTAGDLIFHAACGMAVLSAGALHARLPVLAIWLCNHLLERFFVGACSPLLPFNQDGQVSLPSFEYCDCHLHVHLLLLYSNVAGDCQTVGMTLRWSHLPDLISSTCFVCLWGLWRFGMLYISIVRLGSVALSALATDHSIMCLLAFQVFHSFG